MYSGQAAIDSLRAQVERMAIRPYCLVRMS